TVETHYAEGSLTLGWGQSFFKIPAQNSFRRTMNVQVWNDSFTAALEPDLYSQALSQYLGQNCRLVRYAPFSERKVGAEVKASWSPEVRFADGRPLLLVNEASLQDLNARLADPVGVERFRPNIVVRGSTPYEEDNWSRIRLGEVIFSAPKKCARCVMINIDQKTGVSRGAEPLKTLAQFRREGAKVHFGTLWIPENAGTIRVEDSLEVLGHMAHSKAES
ncbi:MAG: MOSC domain-containing protein, partial [Bdellovibrio sp.]